jgi:protein-L-isoaspartate(D-aspartate) O-methyltransferase
MNITQARENLINNQLKPWGSLNYKANNALKGIPREFFTPEAYKNLAFADIEIPLTDKAKMLYPKIEGRILDALDIKESESVLEIGTGSGYLTACLSILAKDVTSVEIDENLSKLAAEKLQTLNLDNINLEVADASGGLEIDKFFDVVVVGASVPKITGRYFHLVNVGGRIFVVEGVGEAMQAKLITRLSATDWETKSLFETKLDTMLGLEVPQHFEF